MLQRLPFILLILVSSIAEARDLWVDPVNGSDSNSGASRAAALQTITEAWARIPAGTELTEAFHIQLVAGTYPRTSMPNYWERRYGTSGAPVVIQAADGSRTAHLQGDVNMFDTRYVSLIGLDVTPDPPGDVIHCEQCQSLTIHDCLLDGGNQIAQETVKVNQSQQITIEQSTIRGAWDNAIDFVAVEYATIAKNDISNAGDWCMYTKGGSAYITVQQNEIHQCGTGGFTAGQGTGLQFMSLPWVHYEAYDVRVINNVIHDTIGAGLGVNGGYDILIAHNTLYRVGTRSHMIEVVFGARSCDGQPGDPGRDRCQQYIDAGCWGTTVVDDGNNFVRIPNRNIYVYNNLLYNPPGTVSPQIFNIAGIYSGQSSPPAIADQNLQILGNVIFDGDSSTPLGLGDDSGCQSSNPTCNEAQIRRDNIINVFEPDLVNPAGGDFRPKPNGTLQHVAPILIPDFTWSDAPARPAPPPGRLSNAGVTGAVVGANLNVSGGGRRRAVRH